MKKHTFFGVLICAAVGSPAHADWQYTTWNMTPAQVVAASSGSAHLSDGSSGDRIQGYDVGVEGTYTSGHRTFKSKFYFKNNKLSLVHLSTMDAPRCFALANDLKGVYGAPFNSSRSSVTDVNTWQDRSKNNFVALLAIGDDCSLTYKPLKTADAAGL